MKIDMIMPQMGESITEATISKWLKNVGDKVTKDEVILEISTDKVDSEIPAPESGIIAELLYKQGDVVPVKVKIAVIDTDASATVTETIPTEAIPTKAPQDTPKEKEEIKPVAIEQVAQQTKAIVHTSTDTTHYKGDRFYSPLVKGLADKFGVSLSALDSIEGSGQGGRFTKQDLMDYIEAMNTNIPASTARASTSAPVANMPPAVTQQTVPASQNLPSKADFVAAENPKEQRIPMDNMRKAIADHMVRSKATSPHVYSIQEADLSKISAWRAQYKNEFNKKEGFNLSFTPFFLEATVKALQAFPGVNASVDGQTLVLKKNVNLGCAVALGNTGLIVPVIKSAEEKNLVGIARGLNDLALKARNKKLLPDDVAGGTFTVTNPGVFGTLIGTPIINQPQVAILCLGAIEKRPVVVDDMIAIRERCYLTLSYDHRVVDGSLGGQFLKFICEYLQNWDMKRTLY